MYFNYLLNYQPYFIRKDTISELKDLIIKAEKKLKYGLEEIFADIPINLVDDSTLIEKLDETKKKYIDYTRNAKVLKQDEQEIVDYPYNIHKYVYLLEKSFSNCPPCYFAKKGISSAGNEILINGEAIQDPLPLFVWTVYSLCWKAVKGKDFPLTKNPIHPVFFRFMQEPLAVAMTLASVEVAFDGSKNTMKRCRYFLEDLAVNYRSGFLLYELKIHLYWKNWKDDKKRCEGKAEAMERWVDLLSERTPDVDSKNILSTWAELFDLTTAELSGLMNTAASAFAPIICEGSEIHALIIGFIKYASDNPDDFKTDLINNSLHPLALIINKLVNGAITIEEALYNLPQLNEKELSEFLSSHLPGWSLSRDVKSGNYRIYGKVAIIRILKRDNSLN